MSNHDALPERAWNVVAPGDGDEDRSPEPPLLLSAIVIAACSGGPSSQNRRGRIRPVEGPIHYVLKGSKQIASTAIVSIGAPIRDKDRPAAFGDKHCEWSHHPCLRGPLPCHRSTAAVGSAVGRKRSMLSRFGVRLVNVDRPGWGNTDPLHGARSAKAMDAVAVFDALGIERFSAIGFSCGGSHALTLAAVALERVARVVTASSQI